MIDLRGNWAVIANPKAGTRRFFFRRISVEDRLKSAGLDIEFVFSEYVGHATLLTHSFLEDKKIKNFIVVGGDGTLNEVINGIMQSSVNKDDVVFTVIPSGTGNDWARYWRIKKKLKKCIAMILKGNVQSVDVGELNYFIKRKQKTMFFINSVGIGYDAQVVKYAEMIGHFIHGKPWVYSLALIFGAIMHISKHLNLKTSDGSIEVDEKVYTMTIANGPYTGGGIKQAAQAIPNDGKFDVMMMINPSISELFSAIYHVFRSNLQELNCVRYFRTDELCIKTTKRHKIEADGILIDSAKTPFSIKIRQNALKMIVP